MTERTLVLGAVAYAPKVVTIWEGFKRWFGDHGVSLDYVLYSNYERMVEDLVAGRLDVAWNSPLAWLRARRLAAARDVAVWPVAMRDTDCDLASVIVVPTASPAVEIADLRGRRVAVGAPDSPQATLLPLQLLRARGLDPVEVEVRVFDVLGGKHGDHLGGELDAARALAGGGVDAACMIEDNYRTFEADGTLPRGSTRVLARTDLFDHCNFTAVSSAPPAALDRFTELLLAMTIDDPQLRPLMELEGLKRWVPARQHGYATLDAAVDASGFYDDHGAITATGYRY